jgi:hypothetical protein
MPPPVPLPLYAQNLVILNRITGGLGEGAVKDLPILKDIPGNGLTYRFY